MGIYLNPGNSGFTGIRNDIYVDKTGLIALANVTELTGNKFIMIIDEWDAPIRETGGQPGV